MLHVVRDSQVGDWIVAHIEADERDSQKGGWYAYRVNLQSGQVYNGNEFAKPTPFGLQHLFGNGYPSIEEATAVAKAAVDA